MSLARDKYSENTSFRLVTLRPVVSDLKILTFQRHGAGREVRGDGFTTLQGQLDSRFPELKSPKGNGIAYWIENCLWDERHSAGAVRDSNLVRLMRMSLKAGRPLLPEPAEVLLEELRSWAKSAGAARWDPDRDRKIITRDVLHEWYLGRTNELIGGSRLASGGKLAEKMTEAGLPGEVIQLAVEMRRDYAATTRISRYSEPDHLERLQARVKSEMISLRSRLVAGQLGLDGAGFHAVCLDRLDAVNAELAGGSEDRSAYLKGCMYDIADRCLLRFASRQIP